MKLEELRKRITNEGFNTDKTRIVIGDKIELPNATGCYMDESGKWNIYSVSERGRLTVTETGEEDITLDHFYDIAKALNDVYNQYGDMWS